MINDVGAGTDARRDDCGIVVVPLAPGDPRVQPLVAALGARLRELTGDDGASSFQAADVAGPRAVFLAALRDGAAVGCGGLRELDAATCELKRMYAALPGLGIGSLILAELERRAALLGYRRIALATRRANAGAVGFYLARGYRECPPYGAYRARPQSICLDRRC